jgi:FAD/FMN-containing dehydrogenase
MSYLRCITNIQLLPLIIIMGNIFSSSAASPLQTCLSSAIPSSMFATPSTNLFYSLVDVKPYNLDISVSPVAVTFPKTVSDVQAIVKCAAANKVNVQARGGGHSYANYAYGGGDPNTLVVDLSNMQNLQYYDQVDYTCKVGAGGLLGNITTWMANNGNRAFAHGVCPQVGSK